ncbi:MAG: DAK2 domain-containing protein [Dehalococcoidia bacterium]|nr:DAK2 domain-containing protein [Dehalococcoidia bacterium]
MNGLENEDAPVGRDSIGSVEGSSPPLMLSGDELRRAFEAATRCLERYRDAINALNVFPVPDGDTGTNMLLTMRSVNDECSRAADSSVGAVMSAMAHGALLGARGNSGVILSQFFYGLAQGFHGKDESNGEDLAHAFESASRAAYNSVSKPVDGTMLTVIRELSQAATRRAGGAGGHGDPLSVLEAALGAAKESLSRTPLQLPVLREAGVVDAGGQGVVTLLEGAFYCLSGVEVETLELSVPVSPSTSFENVPSPGDLDQSVGQPVVHEEYLASTEEELYGYCTQFLIQGQRLDAGKIREELSSMAGSTVVVGGDDLVKVHVHVHDPGPVISYAVSLGTIDQVSMTNMDQQHEEFMAFHRGQTGTPEAPRQPAGKGTASAVVAVAWGDGYTDLFRGLGCASVVAGGQTMNPSTQELLDAARDTGARDVILLPNNPNIILVARQAATVVEGDPDREVTLHVVPSRTIPQGVAALLAFSPEGDMESVLRSMDEALATVKTIEVTTAVRPVTLGELAVQEGQYIGILEGELVTAEDSAFLALQKTLLKVGPESGQLITLYWGGDVDEGQAGEEAARLQENIPGVEIEVVYGGQPFYHYVASLE